MTKQRATRRDSAASAAVTRSRARRGRCARPGADTRDLRQPEHRHQHADQRERRRRSGTRGRSRWSSAAWQRRSSTWTLAFVRAAAIAARIARPSAPPNSREVLTSPEASPASPGSTPATAAIVAGTNERPMPDRHEQRRRRAPRRGSCRRPRCGRTAAARRSVMSHPDDQQPLGAEPGDDREAMRRAGDDAQRHRQEREPGARSASSRAPAAGTARGRTTSRRSAPPTSSTTRLAALSVREGRSAAASAASGRRGPRSPTNTSEQHEPAGQQRERRARAPAGHVGADDPEHEHRQPERSR